MEYCRSKAPFVRASPASVNSTDRNLATEVAKQRHHKFTPPLLPYLSSVPTLFPIVFYCLHLP